MKLTYQHKIICEDCGTDTAIRCYVNVVEGIVFEEYNLCRECADKREEEE